MAMRPSLWRQCLHRPEGRTQGERAKAKDFTNKRAVRNCPLTDADKETNRRKSQVRAKVEHPFRPLKSLYGFAKARYRGLLKNAIALLHCWR